MRGSRSVIVVAAATIVAAVLRLARLDAVSLWLDEILDYDVATKLAHQDWWRWLIGSTREHGPLFFATELAGRVFTSPELAARIAPALFGVATIPLLWFATREKRTGAIAALLLAISPLHVYYSREARPYALLLLLGTAALVSLLTENVALFAVAIVACAYTTEVSGPLILAFAGAATIAAILTRRRSFVICASLSAAAIALLLLIYRENPGAGGATFPVLDGRFLNELVQSFALQVLPPFEPRRAAYVVLLFAIVGCIDLIRRDRVTGVIVTTVAIAPVAFGLTALAHVNHWYSVRYVSSALPAYLLLVAAGIAFVASLVKREAVAIAIVAVALIALGYEMWPAAREESYRKLDWRVIASTIWHHAAPGDTVLTANTWTDVSLDFYLRRFPLRVHLVNAGESLAIAKHFVETRSPVWIVRAGYEADPAVSQWSCGYPLLLATPTEDFQIHYAPSLAHFVQNRTLEPELRALAGQYASDGCSISFGATDELFLMRGWAGIEGNERWAIDREAALLLPINGAADRVLRFRALPAGSNQHIQLTLDGTLLGDLAMKPGWSDYEIAAPKGAWVGGRHVLTMRFANAVVPGNGDPRALSAMFEGLSVAPAGGNPPPRLALHFIRLQELVPDRHPTRYQRANRIVTSRLGFDPQRSPQLTVEQLTQSFLDESACIDDATFARYAYWSLVGRDMDEPNARAVTAQWRKEHERARLLQGLIETPEFPVPRAK